MSKQPNLNDISSVEAHKITNISDSLVNIYEESKSKRADSSITIESSNIQNNSTHDDFNDLMTRMSTKEYLESVFGKSLNLENLSWIEKIKKILHSNYLHVAVIVLVLVDSLFVTAEVIIDAENKKENENAKVAAQVFKYMGFTVLCVFVVEITLKIAFTFHEFIKSKLEILDAVVVFVSFAIEVAFMDDKEESISSVIMIILIFIRFWRIVRIVNGFVLAVENRSKEKIDQLKIGMNALIKENDSLKQELDKKQKLLNELAKNA